MNIKTITKKIHLTIGILSIFFIIILVLQNSEIVTVNLLFWKLEISRIILILGVLFIGFVLGYIIHGVKKK